MSNLAQSSKWMSVVFTESALGHLDAEVGKENPEGYISDEAAPSSVLPQL